MIEYLRGKSIKWKIILPALVFVAGIVTVYEIEVCNDRIYQEQKRMKTELNAVNYAQQMMSEMQEGAGITEIMEQVVTSRQGDGDYFSAVAENLTAEYVQSIQLAPEGVVTYIYPEEGNEAGKIDLIHDEERGEITRYGIDHDVIVMQGPFDLEQGGKGIAIRNPVFLEDENGKRNSGD